MSAGAAAGRPRNQLRPFFVGQQLDVYRKHRFTGADTQKGRWWKAEVTSVDFVYGLMYVKYVESGERYDEFLYDESLSISPRSDDAIRIAPRGTYSDMPHSRCHPIPLAAPPPPPAQPQPLQCRLRHRQSNDRRPVWYSRLLELHLHLSPADFSLQPALQWLRGSVDGFTVRDRRWSTLEMFAGAALLAFLCILLGQATPLWSAIQACFGLFGMGLSWLLAGIALLVSAIVQLVLGLVMFVLSSMRLLLELLQQLIMAVMRMLTMLAPQQQLQEA